MITCYPMAFFSFSSSSYLHLFFFFFFLPALPLLLIALFILLSRKNIRGPTNRFINLPPGPPGWPVVGNLFQVAFSGKQFFQFIRDLQPIYGPIFTLKMGTRDTIIITSATLAHQALIQTGETFANRPAEHPTRSIFSSNKFSVNSALYGPVWRALRRNMVQGMLSPTRLKEFRELRDSAMERLVDRIRTEAESTTHGTVQVLRTARFAAFSILLSMCFGLPMTDPEIERVDNVLKRVLIALLPRLDDFLPIVGIFFMNQRKRVMEVRNEQIQTLLPFIQKRRSFLQNRGGPKPESFDVTKPAQFAYLDTLFDLKIEARKTTSPTNEELVTLCSEFINGGTDTTAAAIEWGIARLIQKPELQSKIYEEIKLIVGDDHNRKVSEKDVEKMKYLNAFTKELLRKHPPTYFLLSHAVTQKTRLMGYDIPENASIEFFSPGVSDDPSIWANPNEFDPERFLSGKDEADITGVKGVSMMPFGVGRRICPGLGLGMIHISLMIARMVQEFEWCMPRSMGTVDMSEKFEFTVVMKKPLEAVVIPRR